MEIIQGNFKFGFAVDLHTVSSAVVNGGGVKVIRNLRPKERKSVNFCIN